MPAPRTVLVPRERVVRWFDNLTERHGRPVLHVESGALHAATPDGTAVVARLPFGVAYAGPADPLALVAAVTMPRRWGVLLVRKGGFAVASVEYGTVAASKVGQRHVQGRTKAGGQSQQRFARRRDNQARAAYEAAAEHAARVLGAGGPAGGVGGGGSVFGGAGTGVVGTGGVGADGVGAAGVWAAGVEALICGGDRQAVEQVLEDPRLRPLARVRVDPWLAVPDPRRAVLDQAVVDGASVVLTLHDPA